MKIGIEAQRIFRTRKHGMDIYALELIRALQKVDKENQYFIFVKPGPDSSCLQPTENFQIVEIKGLTYADWEQIQLPRAARKYQLDLLHCTSNTAPLFLSVPLILTLHDIIYLNRSFAGGSWYQRLGHHYRKWIVPRLINKAEQILTVSAYEQGNIETHFNGVANKISYLYNGVHPKFRKRFCPEKLFAFKQQLGLPAEYLFFLGNTAPKKNMIRVLKAYALYRNATQDPLPLVIAETSDAELSNLLLQLGLKNLRSHIYLTGYVAHDQLPALYQAARLFLYPSLIESFGIPILEAMSCRVPVITSETSAMPEVAGNAAKLIDPSKEEDISRAITEVLDNPELQAEMVEKGYARAQKFTWEANARQTQAVYQSSLMIEA
jgi:glycosyltransferase involved in cell wall biosynthesis